MWVLLEQNYNIDEITKMEDELRVRAVKIRNLKEEIMT